MASTSEGAFHENDSESGTPGTPGSPGSNESDVPEEFYYFKDLVCPELFRENVPRNTSVLQGEGWVAKIMTTPHAGRFYDNIRMTKPCFYALVDALTSKGFLPQGRTARVSSIEEVLEGDIKDDGKAARNLAKLTLFRQFYIVVIGYLYFTRISLVFALCTIAAYKYQWVANAAEEIAV
ncbi:protein CANDIDATE G-PROTEIN COUPLED RECEPTOR 7 [Sesamum alatum]|uniref:Protein CANDIDATE G-PROTEIN COUPLED RECEPTOR 7 n=1 Tax=Sesamum alatum TaxID=300844 RepID=A0AAE2CE96_9LAMI|nr:protein CANDIDATE G-PROTEIN COUPLED RECEPTOR 7 [Sesamum alatum]